MQTLAKRRGFSFSPAISQGIPAAVGVDIGCGMNAVRTSLRAGQLPDSLRTVRLGIEDAVPCGFAQHAASRMRGSALQSLRRPFDARLDITVGKHPELMKMQRRFNETWLCQLGMLGGGNHFIELCVDEADAVWVMLHSGSRGIGNVIGRYFIAAALDVLKTQLPPFRLDGEAINCHHNYVARERHFGENLFITRKGAISARAGELGIIPGSMGARSYVVRGLAMNDRSARARTGQGGA